MGSVLLLQVLCWIALAVTHALMLDLLSPQFEGDKDIPQVRQQLFQFYLLAFAIFTLVITLILPSFIYVGQRIIRELTELPAQLQEFRVQDAKCFCCTNNHYDPTTGKVLPCDRVLVHRMLERWFSTEDDYSDSSYLDRFNTVVREELSIILLSEGGSTLRFRDAFYASWSCTIPVISDFIPWWANSNLSGVSWFLWFLRGFMLWSYNGIVMMVMMRVCVIVWRLSVAFLDKMPRFLLLTQVAALLSSAMFIWLPFRWWYVRTSASLIG